jgi:hypothetical protein
MQCFSKGKIIMAKHPQANGNADGKAGTALATANAPTSMDEIGQAEVSAMFRPADAASINARIQAGELESAPILATIPEGAQLTCEVLRDDITVIEDVATRQPKQVKIWILQTMDPDTYAKGAQISILGSAQLDRQLPPLMGCVVVIARGGTTKTNKGRQLSEYFVGLDKRAPGNRGRAALPVVDVKS